VKLSDEEGLPVAVLSNHSKSFNRWMELYLEMLFTGAQKSIIVFHQKNQILRFEYYDFDVVSSMCEKEIDLMRSSLSKIISDIAKQATQSDVLYEVKKDEKTLIEVKLKQ
jgi:hypothetical protein